jgi:hypothetical protein
MLDALCSRELSIIVKAENSRKRSRARCSAEIDYDDIDDPPPRA